MNDSLNFVYETIDDVHSDKPAATRRQLVAGAGAALGGMGLLGALPSIAQAKHTVDKPALLNAAATAEVLATIVNTVAFENAAKLGLDDVTKRNIEVAALEEKIHYEFLTSKAVGAKPLTKTIYVPNKYLSSKTDLLTALVAGDQIFVNAYLIAVTTFGNDGNGQIARFAAETMGAEAVHRALALQSLGRLGNDRAFMRYSQPEENQADPFVGTPGARTVDGIVGLLAKAGFGFGKQGSMPGTAFNYDEVAPRTPNPAGVNTRTVR